MQQKSKTIVVFGFYIVFEFYLVYPLLNARSGPFWFFCLVTHLSVFCKGSGVDFIFRSSHKSYTFPSYELGKRIRKNIPPNGD